MILKELSRHPDFNQFIRPYCDRLEMEDIVDTTIVDKVNKPLPIQMKSTSTAKNELSENCWSGYHVQFRNPRDLQQFAIDKKFNRWGDMVEYFKNQDRPYRLSQGSLKDLLYGTYKRKGMHGLSLNDLVTIRKIVTRF